MDKTGFICASKEYTTFERSVPAHYFRRSFNCEASSKMKLRIAVCGLYELWFNGERITRGMLSPYISNTDDMVYFDEYQIITDPGENVIGILLGNGLQNNPGGFIWDFDEASFRSAPKFSLELTDENGNTVLDSGDGFRVHPSPIVRDDYRFGEWYDAREEIPGWEKKGFDDSSWKPALIADPPKGELRLADVSPVIKETEIAPVGIIRSGDGFIYDFGVSYAGVCRMRIRGTRGQKIELRHADSLKNGDLNLKQIWFKHSQEQFDRDIKIVHMDSYICRGEGEEIYQPVFTYHGFRYVRVDGITEDQATMGLLTFCVYHTDLKTRGGFECSDETVNALQTVTRRSILSNFYHFPTDCPQREKNGWTADAALSCEAALMNFDPERNYREWMRNIVKAQRPDGSLPGIIPTGGWGFHWGNGPAWDCVLVWIPYYCYVYRGETDMISECVGAIKKYLEYIRSRTDENGLLAIGLGDWCPVGGGEPKAPLILTDSVTSMDIAAKAAILFDAVGLTEDADFARNEADKYKKAVREHLVDGNTLVARGECQTSQAMCLYYGIYSDGEFDKAFNVLLRLIRDAGDHMDVGVLGGRVIFRLLAEHGHADLALKMIAREDYPSYGNWIKRGATTLWENFAPDSVLSMNHHFWGDISAWFMQYPGGIRLNPSKKDPGEVLIAPEFTDKLTRASAFHDAPSGRISVNWIRKGDGVDLKIEIPAGMKATLRIPKGYTAANTDGDIALESGKTSAFSLKTK